MPALRCACPRCAGGVIYLLVEDYLRAHEGMADTILESEVEASMHRHPSNRSGVATFDDGSQVWIDGTAVATRASRWHTWGPTAELEADA